MQSYGRLPSRPSPGRPIRPFRPMPDLEITFKTRAELQGAQQMLEATEKQIGAAKALGQDYSALEAKAQKLRASIGSQGDALAGATDKVHSIASAIGGKLL